MARENQGSITNTIIELKPSTAFIFIMTALRSGKPVFNHGKPGIGKSDLFRQIAAKWKWVTKQGEQMEGVTLIDVRAILLDPVDLRGLPNVVDGRVVWAIPSFLPDILRDGVKGILLLDELNAAPPLMQAACYQLVLDHQLGEYYLPVFNCHEHEHCRQHRKKYGKDAGWSIVAAGNYDGDKAVTHRMPTPLKTRFVHLNMIPDLEDFIAWCNENNKRWEVTSYLRFRSQALHSFSPDTQTFACPRTWAFVSDIMDAEPSPEVEHALYAGAVGAPDAADFVAYLRTARSLPDIDLILTNPKKATVPKATEPAALYAVAGALSSRANKDNFKNIMEYLRRVPVEFAVSCVRDAGKRDVNLRAHPDFREWVLKNQEYLS